MQTESVAPRVMAAPERFGYDSEPAGSISASLPMARRRALDRPMLGLFVLLALAAALRFHGLDREGYWGDEYEQVQTYGLSLPYTCLAALTRHGFGPADFIIGWFVYRLDPSVWMTRMPAAAWGVVSIAACFFLARRLASWREGLIAAALLAVCRMQLILSQDARPYSMCLALLLITLILLLRALERPTYGRVTLYGAALYLTFLTHSLTPLVFMLVIGVVLTSALVGGWWKHRLATAASPGDPGKQGTALRRLWAATTICGLAAMPVLRFMIAHSPYTAFATVFSPNSYGVDPRVGAKFVTYSIDAAATLHASFGPLVLGLCVIALAVITRRWQVWSTPQRCLIAILLGVGPTFLAVFALTAGVHGFFERYNFYLLPVVALLASLSLGFVIDVLSWTLKPATFPRRAAIIALLALSFAFPVAACAEETRSYRRRDWRGCAAYLDDVIDSDDVVMVLSERPFGRVQHRFYGKYDWPVDRRPLGEAVWTLAVSDSHFQRLRAQTGRCYVVIAHSVGPQRGGEYISHGLQRAPRGYRLAKFRGLDLLLPVPTSLHDTENIRSACDTMIALPHEDASTAVIPLILRSRLQLNLGRTDAAEQSYMRAAGLVPPIQREHFNRATRDWVPSTWPDH